MPDTALGGQPAISRHTLKTLCVSYSPTEAVGDYIDITEMAALQGLSIVEPPIARIRIA